jgi:hypothetical protein
VGVRPVIAKAMHHILSELPMESAHGGGLRKPPVVFSRLARGGKTTCLRLLFEELKANECNPIIISFNGDSYFQRRADETQAQAILRLIASQLVDCTSDERLAIFCTEEDLDKFLGTQKVVLLIDELNILACPPDIDAAHLLRKCFLDKPNRHLVFTTHVPFTLEDDVNYITQVMGQQQLTGSSGRGCHIVPMEVSVNLLELQAMSDNCSSMTPLEVALYGGIPSLIYTVKSGADLSIEERFRNSTRQVSRKESSTRLVVCTNSMFAIDACPNWRRAVSFI